ncbi:MAG TPA: hypothetical protein VGP17_10555 [Solirubrobacteraceae bacterium]|nr:hypothetical protein [Solirubrobacteraceae bacterium]
MGAVSAFFGRLGAIGRGSGAIGCRRGPIGRGPVTMRATPNAAMSIGSIEGFRIAGGLILVRGVLVGVRRPLIGIRSDPVSV